MNPESQTWKGLKAEYLHKVEKALSAVKNPRKQDVLADVRSHLDNRFAELEPAEQNWENFQAIITEMGPPSDYAELLEPGVVTSVQRVKSKHLLWAGIVIVIITAVILLPTVIFPKAKEHKHLTISRVYWFHSDQRPSSIPDDTVSRDEDGHMLFHVEEWFEEIGTAEQYRSFLNQADERFTLKAEGYPDVQANAERGCWSQEFYIRIPKSEYVKMEAGVTYTIEPVNSSPKYQWKVAPRVAICKASKQLTSE